MLCILAALMIAVSVLVILPIYGAKAAETKKAEDYKDSCSLTVETPKDVEGAEGMAADLLEANIVLDVYKLADAEGTPGSDGYTFKFNIGYEKLVERYKELSAEHSNESWKQLAEEAAQIALGDPGMSPTKKSEPGKEINLGDKIDLDDGGWGLYLVIPRGGDIDGRNYITKVKDEENVEWTATMAYSKEYVYYFSPMLISVPYKEGGSTAWGKLDENGNSLVYNAWIPDPEIALKPTQGPRYGSLDIVKELLSYKKGSEAAFVFRVEVKTGSETYTRDVSIVFNDDTGPGKRHVLLDDLPIGADVTVTEIYSGATYKLKSQSPQKVTIGIDKTETVTFVNDYDGKRRDGGSITNHFTYQDGKWVLEQIVDNHSDLEISSSINRGTGEEEPEENSTENNADDGDIR